MNSYKLKLAHLNEEKSTTRAEGGARIQVKLPNKKKRKTLLVNWSEVKPPNF